MHRVRRNRVSAITAAMALAVPFVTAAQSATKKPRGIGAILNETMLSTACAAGFCPGGNGTPRNFIQILGAYTQAIVNILGLIFMVLVIWGGFKWMTAAGNEEQVNKAKGVVRNAIIGLTLIVLARVITTVFLNIVGPAVLP